MPLVSVVVVVTAVAAVVAIAQLAGDDRGGPDAASSPGAATGDAPATTFIAVPIREAPPAPVDGVVFTDPEGTYTLTLSSHWPDISARTAAGTEAWAVAGASAGFAPNVTVVSQTGPGVDLDSYLAGSVAGLDELDAELVDQAYVPAPDGALLGVLRYAATPRNSPIPLEFLAVIDVDESGVVVATLTAPVADFDALAADVEPYLFTLEATG